MKKRTIITVLLAIIVIMLIINNCGSEKFRPFSVNEYNHNLSDLDTRFNNNPYGGFQTLPYFKMGEIKKDGYDDRYNEYIKKLYNKKLDEKISKYNTACNCQKKDN
jgi:hypothetical protein